MGRITQWLTIIVAHKLFCWLSVINIALLLVFQFYGKHHPAVFNICAVFGFILALISFIDGLNRKIIPKRSIVIFLLHLIIPVIYLISGIIHHDFTFSSVQNIQLKLYWPLLAAVFLFTKPFSEKIEKSLLYVFLFSVTIFFTYQMALYLIAVLTQHYTTQYHEYLYYREITIDFLHHITSVVFSIGLATCLLIIEFDLHKKSIRIYKLIFLICVMIVLFVAILMSGARVGLLCTLVSGCIYIVYKIKQGAYYLIFYSLAVICVSVITLIYLYQKLPSVKTRTDITIEEIKSIIQHDYSQPIVGYGNLTVRVVDLIYHSDLMFVDAFKGLGPSQEKFLKAQDEVHARKQYPSHVYELRPAHYWFRVIVMLGFPMAIAFFIIFLLPVYLSGYNVFFLMIWSSLFIFSNLEDLYDHRITFYFVVTTYFYFLRVAFYVFPSETLKTKLNRNQII